MKLAKVVRKFKDRDETIYEVDEFLTVEDDRAEELLGKNSYNKEYIKIATVAETKEHLDGRGIEYDTKATKDDLFALL